MIIIDTLQQRPHSYKNCQKQNEDGFQDTQCLLKLMDTDIIQCCKIVKVCP